MGATPKFDPSGKPKNTTKGTIVGNCGSAYVTFQSKTRFTTGYWIRPTWGKPLSHSWNVALSSRVDSGSYNLNGLAPAGQSWSAFRDFNETALKGENLTALAGGNTLTTLGSCRSGGPTATLRF